MKFLKFLSYLLTYQDGNSWFKKPRIETKKVNIDLKSIIGFINSIRFQWRSEVLETSGHQQTENEVMNTLHWTTGSRTTVAESLRECKLVGASTFLQ